MRVNRVLPMAACAYLSAVFAPRRPVIAGAKSIGVLVERLCIVSELGDSSRARKGIGGTFDPRSSAGRASAVESTVSGASGWVFDACREVAGIVSITASERGPVAVGRRGSGGGVSPRLGASRFVMADVCHVMSPDPPGVVAVVPIGVTGADHPSTVLARPGRTWVLNGI